MFGIRYFSPPRKQLSFDAAVAGAEVGAGASDGAGEDDGIIASGVYLPQTVHSRSRLPLATIRHVDRHGLQVCQC